MTFSVIPRVDLRIDPSNIEKITDNVVPDYVIGSLFSLSELSPPSLNMQVGAGKALIKGYYVEITAAETKAMAASSTNHVYLQLTRNANNEVNGAQITSNTTGVAPSDSMKIAEVVTNASEITTITSKQDLREDEDIVVFRQRSSAPSDQENDTFSKIYMLALDSNNKKLTMKMKVGGSIQEVLLWG